MRIGDWSSDVCSSDLTALSRPPAAADGLLRGGNDAPAHPRAMQGQARRTGRLQGHQVTRAAPGPGDRGMPLRPRPAIRPGRIPGAHRSEEHTSELQSLMRISYAVLVLKQNKHTLYSNR